MTFTKKQRVALGDLMRRGMAARVRADLTPRTIDEVAVRRGVDLMAPASAAVADHGADGGFLIPESMSTRLIWALRERLRRASKGFRKHARDLKRRGQWRGGAVSPHKPFRHDQTEET